MKPLDDKDPLLKNIPSISDNLKKDTKRVKIVATLTFWAGTALSVYGTSIEHWVLASIGLVCLFYSIMNYILLMGYIIVASQRQLIKEMEDKNK